VLRLVITLLKKDLRRAYRSPVGVLASLAFPFIMAGMIGSISSGGGSGFPRVKLLVWDQDESFLSRQLFGMLGSEQFQEYVEVVSVEEDGPQRMEKGEASALLIIPEGFGDDVLDGGDDVRLQLVKNPAESIKPEIVQQGGEILVTYLDMGGKVLGDEFTEVVALFDQDEFPGAAEIVRVSTVLIERISSLESYIFPPILQLQTVKEKQDGEEDDAGGINVFGYVLIMVSVMALLFVSSRAVMGFFEEEKTGMIRRQLVAPISIRHILAGRIAYSVALALIVEILLLGAGMLLGWIDTNGGLLGAVLIMTVYSVATAGLMTVIYGLSRTEKQGALLGFIIIMGMSVLGGSMMPVDNFPAGLQRLSHLTLNYWAVDGLLDQLVFKNPLVDVTLHLGILAAFAVVTLVVGASLAQRKLRAGV